MNALKLLGQHLALFTDRQIVETQNGNPFESLSDDEIIKMYEEQNKFTNKKAE